jgi:hypothetical protein
MNIVLSLLIAVLFALSGISERDVYLFTSFREPADEGLRFLYSYDGYNWQRVDGIFLKPEVGMQKVMRDPSVVQGSDGIFHLVWTSSWKGDPGFGYTSSPDLINWSEQRFIPVMAYDTSNVNVWAPELYYDDERSEFIIVWASTVPFRFEKGIEDEYNNHRLYYTTTKDFKAFSDTKLFLDPGFSVIDAVIVKRGKNDYVLVLKDNTRPQRNLRVAFGTNPLGPYTGISGPITDTFTEGPTVLKMEDEWLVYFDAYRRKQYGAVKTKDFITFTDISGEINIPEGHKHGTIFKVDEKILKGLIKEASKKTQSTLLSEVQDTIRYTGKTLSNIDYHHGQLSPAIGVHNIQVMHANREYPAEGDGFGWTYNHAPMLSYWNNTFYLQYLSNPVGEHIPPGQTMLVTSKDGYHWSKPQVLFPSYKIPDGTTKKGQQDVAKDLFAVMHQRMGFYVSEKNRLLTLAYYGISFGPKDSPNDGKGIGRVVREIYPDGNFGPIYFIRYNDAWNEKNTSYPYYQSARDKDFLEACNELLANPLMMQQWVEEADRDDPLIPLKKQLKAFSYYHLPDGRVVGLWKHALTSVSDDGGNTWMYEPVRAPGFVNANAKIWGQRTSDGRYATVYNPSEFRWPLAISVSDDGLNYKNLLLVNGEISTMRYGGNYKSYGPQYVRGIPEGNGTPPDGNLWVTYSMNKEDIWIASVPVPVKDEVTEPVNEVFNEMPDGEELKYWNIFCPVNAPVSIEKMSDGRRCLGLRDKDRYDYAKAERSFPASGQLAVEFSLIPAQDGRGILHIELQDRKGIAAIRLVLDSLGICSTKAGYRYSEVMKYHAGTAYDFRISFDTRKRMYAVNINGREEKRGIFFAPVKKLSRIVFRTGEVRRFPDADTPTDQDFDVPDGGEPVKEAAYYILNLKTAGHE